MKSKIKSIKAWAVVDKENPKLKVLEIYEDDDITILKGEKLVRVEIVEVITKKK